MDQEKPPISVYIEGSIPIEDQLLLFCSLDKLYRSLGGSGLEISDTNSLELVSEPDSPYDQLKGTPFESGDQRLEPSPTTHYVKRCEVYIGLRKIVKTDKLKGLVAALDKKFPETIWQDNLPRGAVIGYLFNQQRNTLRV